MPRPLEVRSTLCLVVVLVTLATLGRADLLTTQTEILRKLFNDLSIQSEVRPPARLHPSVSYFGKPVSLAGDPVVVTISMFLLDVSDIDDDRQEFKVTFYLRQFWNDPRLKYTSSEARLEHVTLKDPEKLWVPDLFALNEKQARIGDVTTRNAMIRIRRNGDVFYSTRLSMTLGCPMDHSRFPLDQQRCSISLESYGYLKRDVVFIWNDTNPLQVQTGRLGTKPFQLLAFGYDYCDSKTSTGEYGCVRGELLLVRRVAWRALLESGLPLIVLLSISLAMVGCPSMLSRPWRTAIATGSLLITALVAAQVSSRSPATGDVTALDRWALTAILFALLSLLALLLAACKDRRYSTHLGEPEESTKMATTAADLNQARDIVRLEDDSLRHPLDQPGEAAACAACLGFPRGSGGRVERTAALLLPLLLVLVVTAELVLCCTEHWWGGGLSALSTARKIKY